MSLDFTACAEYITISAEADFTPLREAAMAVLVSDEPVIELDVPAALTARITTLPDQWGVLAWLAAGITDETAVDGVKVYAAEVGGVAKIFARRVSS